MSSDTVCFASEATIDSYHNRLRLSKKLPNNRDRNVVHEPKFGKQKITYLSHCPEKQCSKYYVDTLMGRYYFICKDEYHEYHDRTALEGGNN